MLQKFVELVQKGYLEGDSNVESLHMEEKKPEIEKKKKPTKVSKNSKAKTPKKKAPAKKSKTATKKSKTATKKKQEVKIEISPHIKMMMEQNKVSENINANIEEIITEAPEKRDIDDDIIFEEEFPVKNEESNIENNNLDILSSAITASTAFENFDRKIVWRVNFKKFLIKFRTDSVLNFIRNKYTDTAFIMMCEFLMDFAENTKSHISKNSSKISLSTFVDFVEKKDLNFENSRELKDSTPIFYKKFVELNWILDDRVSFTSIFASLQSFNLNLNIRKQLGDGCQRIFSLLLEQKFLDSKQVNLFYFFKFYFVYFLFLF